MTSMVLLVDTVTRSEMLLTTANTDVNGTVCCTVTWDEMLMTPANSDVNGTVC
jgi:hypothetical protein